MSTAELRARHIFKTYHLNSEDFEVKRNLMILLLSPEDAEVDKPSATGPDKMTHDDISMRLAAAEEDILSGRGIACEDVHRNIEEKCPWL